MKETLEMQVRSLGQEDPLEEGHGHPLQYSCLENSTDREAWWASSKELDTKSKELKQLGTHIHNHQNLEVRRCPSVG